MHGQALMFSSLVFAYSRLPETLAHCVLTFFLSQYAVRLPHAATSAHLTQIAFSSEVAE